MREEIMLVKEWMTPDPVCCPPDTTVHDAVHRMAAKNIGSILVVQNEKLVGIFTERDVMQRVVAAKLNPNTTPLSQVMTPNPDTVRPGDDILRVYRRLLTTSYRHLPVVDNGRPVGIISIRTPHLADMLIVAEYHLGREHNASQLEHIVDKDFEDELTEYIRQEFGSKLFKEFRNRGELDILKDKLRKEFTAIYRSRTGTRRMDPGAK